MARQRIKEKADAILEGKATTTTLPLTKQPVCELSYFAQAKAEKQEEKAKDNDLLDDLFNDISNDLAGNL